MATTQQPPVGNPQNQPQHNPGNDPIQMTPEQLRRFAESGVPPGQPQPQPQPTQQPPVGQPPVQQPPVQQPPTQQQPQALQPIQLQDGSFELRLPTGQVYKGANASEVWQRVAEAQVAASQRIRDLSDEATRYREGLAAVTGRQPVGPNGQPVQQGPQPLRFDAAVYNELHKQDPQLALQYQLGAMFGVADINEVPGVVNRLIENSARYETQMTINNFKAMAPDFPGTDQAIKAVMDFIAANNIPFTAPNLKMVHDGMVRAHAANPQTGYAPLAPGQFPQVAPAPQAQPQANTQPAPAVNYDPNPQGPYAFNPDRGFGAYQPAPVPAPVAQPTATAAPVPTAGFPTMPQVSAPAAPPPAPPTGMPAANQPAQIDEAKAATMTTQELRQYIESQLQPR